MSRIIKDNKKNIFETLDIMYRLNQDHEVSLSDPFHLDKSISANLVKDKRGFVLKINTDHAYKSVLGKLKSLKMSIKEFFLIVDNPFVSTVSGSEVTINISDFKTEGFVKSTKRYFRLILPVVEKKLDFNYFFTQCGYQTDRHSSIECLRINYSSVNVDLYLYNKENSQYLIIDSIEELSYGEFSDYCFSTLVAHGFITGQFIQNEGYFFSYQTRELNKPQHVFYTVLRPSLFSSYTPIYRNAFGYMRGSDEAVEVNKALRVLTPDEFSRLCKWAFDSIEINSILILIIEACSASLLVMPAGLSVALEGLTNLITANNKDSVSPITDKELARRIIAELIQVVDSNTSELSPEGLTIIKRKLELINQPTNQSKLTKPFDMLGFNLTDEDLKVIKHRNDFLHGRLTLKPDDSKKDNGSQIYYVALRLYTLVSILILKSLGYDNKIVNYPKIHDHNFLNKLDEPYFRQI